MGSRQASSLVRFVLNVANVWLTNGLECSLPHCKCRWSTGKVLSRPLVAPPPSTKHGSELSRPLLTCALEAPRVTPDCSRFRGVDLQDAQRAGREG